jgi:hypothetical protein
MIPRGDATDIPPLYASLLSYPLPLDQLVVYQPHRPFRRCSAKSPIILQSSSFGVGNASHGDEHSTIQRCVRRRRTVPRKCHCWTWPLALFQSLGGRAWLAGRQPRHRDLALAGIGLQASRRGIGSLAAFCFGADAVESGALEPVLSR